MKGNSLIWVKKLICGSGSRRFIGIVFTILALFCLAYADSKRGDFDGDGRSDLGVYRPSDQAWFIFSSAGYPYFVQYGSWPTDYLKCIGDFDNNGTTDFPPVTNFPWSFGRMPNPDPHPTSGSGAVCRDYDGDHRTDRAFWAPATGSWMIETSGGASWVINWGIQGDLPVPDDYDGDGRADIAVYRPSSGDWYILFSSTGESIRVQWGAPGDRPVFADYDGDGRADIAVYRPADGNWFMLMSRSNWTGYRIVNWGTFGDIPVPGDYDGDGKYDVAQYRPSNGYWFPIASSGVNIWPTQWGASTDLPVPAMYLP